jgi:hypothetical protein
MNVFVMSLSTSSQIASRSISTFLDYLESVLIWQTWRVSILEDIININFIL